MPSSPREAARQVLADKPIRDELVNLVSNDRQFRKAVAWNITPPMLRAVIEAPDVAGGGRGRDRGPVREGPPGAAGAEPGRPYTEAVIREYGRPSLLIRNGWVDELPDSAELRKRVQRSRGALEPRLASVGRIEISADRTDAGSLGTGWLIAERVIVTNRHVAELFAARKGKGYVFARDFLGDARKTLIDFREEYSSEDALEFEVDQILFVEDADLAKPDVALLRLKSGRGLPAPIPVQREAPAVRANVAVVGYPAYDERGGSRAMEPIRRVYGDIFDVKRLAPGQVTAASAAANKWFFAHDATTLGGNSGSAVIDMESGHAVGLHFSGEYFRANYAVRGQTLLDYLAKQRVKVSVPRPPAAARDERPAPVPGTSAGESRPVEEAPVASYADRDGYDPGFLSGATVPMPKVTGARKSDVLSFKFLNKQTTELKYIHFSVVMSKSRRLCFFSAVNIDGEQAESIRGQRPAWRTDSRIPTERQIKGECYGNESDGKFSRGHMTRREDPNWGGRPLAVRANADTMHVTNACPQMQPHNAGVWLGLEEYALQNAKRDDMRISVFTGPIFDDADPVYFGVRVPQEFWKVIAFIHDDTGKLTATGYTISQKGFLPGLEFVFGKYLTYQKPLAEIESRTSLSFGKLTAADGMRLIPESVAVPLVTFEQIRF